MVRVKIIVILSILVPVMAFAQKTDSLVKKLDSLEKKTDSVGHQVNNVNPAEYNESTRVTAPVYFILLGSDMKQQFLAPFHLSGKSWLKVAAFGGALMASTLVDEPVQQQVIKVRDRSADLRRYSNYITNTGGLYEAYTLAAIGAYGVVFKKEKVRTITLLATQAYFTSAAISTAAKFLFSRQRPSVYDPNHLEAEPTFHGPFAGLGNDKNGKKTNGSFPSGHTTLAFAAATVYAKEYANHPLIPVISYSAASLIGLSRITENKHWTTDVLAGALLGYLSGRQVVNNYHRYAKIQNTKPGKKKLSFNLNYSQGALLSGLTYRP